MKAVTSALTLALCMLCGCGGKPESQLEHAHEEAATEPEAPEGHANLVRIDREMLRDLRVTTSPVESRPASDGVMALGEVGVNEDRYAEVATPITARVSQVLAGIGDEVTVGQPLAVLESIELGKARGELVSARARAELARQSLARKRGLAADRIVPRREVQEAEATAAAATADLQAAEAALRALGAGDEANTSANPAQFALRSPVAGVVIERELARGQIAEPTRPLFRVGDLSQLWLTVHAFERDAVRVSPGARARVTLAALPGRSFAGTVTLVGRRVDAASRTVAVRVELPNDDGLLRPGMSASAWLPLGEGAAMVVAVPAASLQRLHDGWAVFIPRGSDAFEIRRVGRGRDLGGEVEIVHGAQPGETVVVDGAFLLKAEAEKTRGEGEHHEH
ncbi:MAG TPA: efflux RND transporter periplasmic adaptor subunit [Candidatus Binatia bacterium]|nr:efflux RND transporter periplasmic adaptor subunit [Candidatus Binatia bacterium]